MKVDGAFARASVRAPMKRVLFAAVIAVSSLAIGSCGAPTDLNKPCVMVKKDPNDPSKSLPITQGDIQSNPNRDVISFGSTECEDLVCVHEAGAPLNGAPTDALTGFCSRACAQGASANTCASAEENLDKDPVTAFSCRSLLLDEATLGALKQNDPATYKQYFGDTTSPYFCARAPHESAANP